MAWGELCGVEDEGCGSAPADVSAISAETACGGELAVCSPLPPTRLDLARKPVLSK